MVNFNGVITSGEHLVSVSNRGFLYGDGVFETVKMVFGKVLFLEDHYFRLMSSMRILRMEIPMTFTMEYFETQILMLTDALKISHSARARITIYRNGAGYYLPTVKSISFVISAEAQDIQAYRINPGNYEVDIFKDYYVTAQLLSSIKSTNRIINITGSIFASENGLQNCLLMNDSKNIIEALQGNIFMLTGDKLVTPPVSQGCLNGVMRKQVLRLAKQIESLQVMEETISPFDLQKADEIFITNVIKGIQPITKYRKKEYGNSVAVQLIKALNVACNLIQ